MRERGVKLTVFKRENFACNDPSDWTPSRGEKHYIYADKCDRGFLSCNVKNDCIAGGILAGCGRAYDSNDKL